MQALNNLGALAGRILLALVFMLSGFFKFLNLAGTAAMMDKAGMHTMVFPQAIAAAFIELVGGILLILGFQTRVVALILFLFMIPVTLIFHLLPGGQMNEVHTMKNFAIMGGLLMVATQGGGGLSFDRARAATA